MIAGEAQDALKAVHHRAITERASTLAEITGPPSVLPGFKYLAFSSASKATLGLIFLSEELETWGHETKEYLCSRDVLPILFCTLLFGHFLPT